MSENYKFFQNKSCEFFPCHKLQNIEDFNCLFCFCPVYYLTECGGKFSYTEDGIKSCENCIIPHVKETGYSFILNKIKRK